MSCTIQMHANNWSTLKFVGYYRYPFGPALEIRKCDRCGNEIARELSGDDDPGSTQRIPRMTMQEEVFVGGDEL